MVAHKRGKLDDEKNIDGVSPNGELKNIQGKPRDK